MIGDLLFIGGFVILPLAVIVWSVSLLRASGPRRPRRRAPEADLPASAVPSEPVAQRDWAASVRPRRTAPAASPGTHRRRYYPPPYRGRAGGVVRRVTPRAARRIVSPRRAPLAGPDLAPAGRRRR